MKQRIALALWCFGMVALLAVTGLVACDGEQATSAQVGTGDGETYTSEVLNTSYPNALSISDQLALGVIRLEETDHAVTSEQAAALLPLWLALQGGVTTQIEVNAVYKQIEGTITQEQLQAIAAMQLTQDNLQTWMQQRGGESRFPLPSGEPGGRDGFADMSEEEQAALQATMQAGGGVRGGRPAFEGMNEEQREAWQATAEAGGGMPSDRGGFADMSEEERAALRATVQAGGRMPGVAGFRQSAGGGQFNILLGSLIELLQARAEEE